MTLLNEKQLLNDKANKNSREQIILHYIPYVQKLVSHYEYDREDLFGEGMLGLVKAIDTYDENKCSGNFLGYAKYYILRHIYSYLCKAGLISLPQWVGRAVMEYHNTYDMLQDQNRIPPTEDTVLKKLGWPKKKWDRIKSIQGGHIRLDQNIFDDVGRKTTIGDVIESFDDSILDDVDKKVQGDIVNNKLKYLSAGEYEVILLRYYSGYSQQKTADVLGVSYHE